jgi:hypothetical protein
MLSDKTKEILIVALCNKIASEELSNSVDSSSENITALSARIDVLVEAFLALLVKLDQDTGVTSTDYTSTLGDVE